MSFIRFAMAFPFHLDLCSFIGIHFGFRFLPLCSLLLWMFFVMAYGLAFLRFDLRFSLPLLWFSLYRSNGKKAKLWLWLCVSLWIFFALFIFDCSRFRIRTLLLCFVSSGFCSGFLWFVLLRLFFVSMQIFLNLNFCLSLRLSSHLLSLILTFFCASALFRFDFLSFFCISLYLCFIFPFVLGFFLYSSILFKLLLIWISFWHSFALIALILASFRFFDDSLTIRIK